MSSLRNLDLNLLKVFDAIYVSGSVSAAADKLGVSQPSISRGLSRLREHFDDVLFVRSGNGVAPTPKAESMLDSIRGALSLIESTAVPKGAFDLATHARNFKLLLPDPAEVKVMPHLINLLPQGSPVTFEVFAVSNLNLAKAFSSGEVDAAVLPYVPEADDVVYQKLYTEKGALIARKNHPLMKDGFSLPLLGQLKFVALPDHIYRLAKLDEVLSAFGLKVNVVCKTHKLSSMPYIVETTDLVTFMPFDYAQTLKKSWDIDVFSVPDNDMSRQDVYLAYPKTTEDSPAIHWVCAEIKAAYETLSNS